MKRVCGAFDGMMTVGRVFCAVHTFVLRVRLHKAKADTIELKIQ